MKKPSFMCVFIFCICTSIFATSKPVMVISSFDAKGIDVEDVEFVMNIFTSTFANLGVANIVDRSSFDKIKKELSFQDSDWSDSNKVAELGRALNANQVVVGQLMKRRNKVILTVKILDVNTTAIVAANIDTVDDIDDFLDKMSEFCNTLIGKSNKSTSSTSQRSTNSSDSSIGYDKYQIGDEGPGGGIVFYASKEGFYVYDGIGGKVLCHYLEMSKESITLTLWTDSYSNIGTEIGLGYGKSNTYKILKEQNPIRRIRCAAYWCDVYSTPKTKPGDWWLPSKAELDLMFQNQKAYVYKTCENGYHWSSSEYDKEQVHSLCFSPGERFNTLYKDVDNVSVRAVRAF